MKYTVTKAVQLPTGSQVKLTKEQARRRGAQVAAVKGGQFECLVPVWFKAGEIIDIDEPAKHVLASLDPLDKARAKAEAKAAAAAAEAERLADEQAAAAEAERIEAEALAELEAEEAERLADEQAAADSAAAQNTPPAE